MPYPAVPAASLNIEISTWRNLILIPAPVDLNTRLDRLLHCIHCRTAVEECSTNLTELHRGDTPSPLQCNYSQFLSESQTESSTAAMNVIENKMKERCVVREQSRRDLSVTWRGNDGEDGDWEGEMWSNFLLPFCWWGLARVIGPGWVHFSFSRRSLSDYTDNSTLLLSYLFITHIRKSHWRSDSKTKLIL